MRVSLLILRIINRLELQDGIYEESCGLSSRLINGSLKLCQQTNKIQDSLRSATETNGLSSETQNGEN